MNNNSPKYFLFTRHYYMYKIILKTPQKKSMTNLTFCNLKKKNEQNKKFKLSNNYSLVLQQNEAILNYLFTK